MEPSKESSTFQRIIVTACNSLYYNNVLTLIASLHRTSYNCFEMMIIYNLGLSEDELNTLKSIEKVQICEFPHVTQLPFPEFLVPKQHAYKALCVERSADISNIILWLDAGCVVLRNIEDIFNIIELEDIFLIEDCNWSNNHWTSPKCRQIMEVKDDELTSRQLCSGFIGYKKNGKYQRMIIEASVYSQIKDCVHGSPDNHRHDQTIYSILSYRYKCPRYPLHYAEWESLEKALSENSYFFAHRHRYYNIEGIRFK